MNENLTLTHSTTIECKAESLEMVLCFFMVSILGDESPHLRLSVTLIIIIVLSR